MSSYGCFTTVRLTPDGIRGWDEHLRRLVRDTAALFERPVTEGEVTAALRAAAADTADTGRPVLLRIAVTARDHTVNRPGGTDLVVEVTGRPAYSELGPLRVVTVAHRRALPEVKHLATTPELLVRRRAQAAGYDDALFVSDGRVTEGPTWSLVARIGEELVSPSGALPSVTVRLLARTHPIAVRPVAPDELATATDAVAVNAGWGVRSIAAIDGAAFDGAAFDGAVAGDLAERLAAAHLRIRCDPV